MALLLTLAASVSALYLVPKQALVTLVELAVRLPLAVTRLQRLGCRIETGRACFNEEVQWKSGRRIHASSLSRVRCSHGARRGPGVREPFLGWLPLGTYFQSFHAQGVRQHRPGLGVVSPDGGQRLEQIDGARFQCSMAVAAVFAAQVLIR